MNKQHHYQMNVKWTGSKGSGTSSYRGYERSHEMSVMDKEVILCSSDPAFRGDRTKYNPEELLVASLSSCHLLWFLHLCAEAGVVVVEYEDEACGVMIETANGGGHFTEVTLYPSVTVTEASMIEVSNGLHERANALCFIANSVNFPVHHVASCRVEGSSEGY